MSEAPSESSNQAPNGGQKDAEHDFHVEPFTPDRVADVQRLWGQVYSAEEIEQRTRLFEWFALGNPFVSAEHPPYYLLFDGDAVVGIHGHAPWPWSLGGRRVQGFMCYDDMLSMDYRGKGLGKIMLNGAAERRPELAGALWHNEANNRLYSKAGWHDFTDFFPLVKIYDPTPILRSRFGPLVSRVLGAPGRVALTVREALRKSPATSGYRFERIDRFGDEFDAFFASQEDQFDAIVVRDARYLNWKFVDKPFTAFERIAARDSEGRLAGYVVFRTREADDHVYGSVLDFFADPRGDAFPALMQEALKEMTRAGVQDVRIACTHPPFIRALEQLGFVRTRRPLHFMVHHWEGTIEPAWAQSARHWYLTYSDGDGDCWTTS